jgi:catechol 2,3-dioxygenase-like lactoylglutathione lyase family enzyme
MASYSITGCCLLVADLERSIAFYTRKIGFELDRKAPGFAQYKARQGVHLSTWEAGHFHAATGLPDHGARPLNKMMAALLLPSQAAVDAAYAELKERGVSFVHPPKRHAWNAYATYFDDPDGNIWEIFWWPKGDEDKAGTAAQQRVQGAAS